MASSTQPDPPPEGRIGACVCAHVGADNSHQWGGHWLLCVWLGAWACPPRRRSRVSASHLSDRYKAESSRMNLVGNRAEKGPEPRDRQRDILCGPQAHKSWCWARSGRGVKWKNGPGLPRPRPTVPQVLVAPRPVWASQQPWERSVLFSLLQSLCF